MEWAELPRGRLLADVSLWSADLANLAAETARISPFADSFHFDVADAHFAPGLLFFPVHLMVDRPSELAGEFLTAGTALITVQAEAGEPEVGVSAAIDSSDILLRLGTAAGIKGQDLAPQACARLRDASRLVRHRGVRLIADGGIRAHTVPLLRRAGADVVVPGSLVFQSADPAETFRWLQSLPGEDS